MKRFGALLFLSIYLLAASCSSALYEAVLRDDTGYLATYKGDINQRLPECDCSPVILAVIRGKTNMALSLIKAGADVNSRESKGFTALTFAVFQNFGEIAEALISAGADVNLAGSDGWSPLMLASYTNNAEMVRLLIRSGARINHADNEGWTSLMVAAQFGCLDSLRELIRGGAELNARNNRGNTAIMEAAYVNRAEAVSVLIGAKADLNAADKNGGTLLGNLYALENMSSRRGKRVSYAEIIRMLEDAGALYRPLRSKPESPLDPSVEKRDGRMLVFGMVSNNSSVLIRSVDGGKVLMNRFFTLDGEVWLEPGKHVIDAMCQFDYRGMKVLEPCEPLTITVRSNFHYMLQAGEKKDKYLIECRELPGVPE